MTLAAGYSRIDGFAGFTGMQTSSASLSGILMSQWRSTPEFRVMETARPLGDHTNVKSHGGIDEYAFWQPRMKGNAKGK